MEKKKTLLPLRLKLNSLDKLARMIWENLQFIVNRAAKFWLDLKNLELRLFLFLKIFKRWEVKKNIKKFLTLELFDLFTPLFSSLKNSLNCLKKMLKFLEKMLNLLFLWKKRKEKNILRKWFQLPKKINLNMLKHKKNITLSFL